jgi:hypothetical protein
MEGHATGILSSFPLVVCELWQSWIRLVTQRE